MAKNKFSISSTVLREIAIQLETGKCCFWNYKTHAYFFADFSILNENPITNNELDPLTSEKLEDFFVVEPMQSKVLYKVMDVFIEKLPESYPLKSRLAKAITKNRPFSEFRMVVSEDEEMKNQWIKFKIAHIEVYVKNELNFWLNNV